MKNLEKVSLQDVKDAIYWLFQVPQQARLQWLGSVSLDLRFYHFHLNLSDLVCVWIASGDHSVQFVCYLHTIDQGVSHCNVKLQEFSQVDVNLDHYEVWLYLGCLLTSCAWSILLQYLLSDCEFVQEYQHSHDDCHWNLVF